ncbi:MAG: hypothetical protein SGJ27_04700 [Candidatus Melainabacteria bacterium]|nr:hypothetical protein [Candidatus Melainabacteria bacterium]
MRNSLTIKLIAVAALFSLATPAFARNDDRHDGRRDGRNDRHVTRHYTPKRSNQYHKYNKHVYKQVNRNNNKQVKHYYKNQRRAVQSAKWDWNRHNWNEQRNYVHNNWAARSAQVSAAQRAQLDSQLRAQWLAYHNNNWNGGYEWNQYNDPQFLDYIHNRQPGLMTSIRNAFRF